MKLERRARSVSLHAGRGRAWGAVTAAPQAVVCGGAKRRSALCFATVESREVLDARYEVVAPPRPPLTVASVFWFAVYLTGFVWAATEWAQPGAKMGVGAMVVGAALIVPTGRLLSWAWRAVRSEVSAQEAQALRLRLYRGR